MIIISEANFDDFKHIQEIAYQTWPDTYGAILSKEQLDYMLALFYSEAALVNNVQEKAHYFLMAKENDTALGFASYEHNFNHEAVTRIHKIYVLPQTQGKGIGKLLIAAVESLATENQSDSLSLNVNRFNNALSFYQKLGFEIVGEEDIELDHGYLMEDYIMEKKL